MSAGGRRLETLTALRFVAALIVVMFHARFDHWGWANRVLEIARPGPITLSFFFILSGFVLVWSASPDDTLRSYYRRRVARIFPLHLLVWAYFGLLVLATSGKGGWGSFLAGVPLLQAWVPDPDVTYAFNFPAWSLSAELFFYLLFPALLLLLPRLSRRRAFVTGVSVYAGMWLVAAVAWLTLSGPTLKYVLSAFPPYRLGEFVIGMLLGLAVRDGWTMRVPLAVPVVGFVAFGFMPLAIGNLSLYDDSVILENLLQLPLLLALVLWAVNRDLRPGGSGVPAIFVKLGTWSYAMYLIHEPLKNTLLGIGVHGTAWALAVHLVLVVVVAGLLYQFWERPMERLLRAPRKRRAGAVSATASPARAPEVVPVSTASAGTASTKSEVAAAR